MNRKKRNNDISENSIIIRYSNPILFYTICIVGSLTIVSSTLFFSDFDWDKLFKLLNFIDHDILGVLLFIFFILLASVIFFMPFFTALYITDKKISASFSKTGVEIQKSGNTIRINYNDIEQIKFATVLSASKGLVYTSSLNKPNIHLLSRYRSDRRGFGPYLYRVIIYTHKKKYKINCSFKEAWQCRRKKISPTIYPFTVMLEKQSGCKVEYTTNIWG